jgi:hypothetical protein
MSLNSSAIERLWHAEAPTGEKCPVTLSVSSPRLEPDGPWFVVVSMVGLEDDALKIYGEDGWQAVVLGMRFIATRIEDYSSRGWRFTWGAGGESVGAGDLGVG